jgi:hypothetical protein
VWTIQELLVESSPVSVGIASHGGNSGISTPRRSFMILLSLVVAIGSAVFFYTRHRNRIEPERRVPAVVYALAVIVCGGIAGFLGVAFGTSWACSRPNPGNLCGLVGLFVCWADLLSSSNLPCRAGSLSHPA